MNHPDDTFVFHVHNRTMRIEYDRIGAIRAFRLYSVATLEELGEALTLDGILAIADTYKDAYSA